MPITLFKKLFFQFDKKHKLYVVFIFFIFLLQMFLELFSITLFIPLISFILDTNINENKFYIFFKENLGIDLIFILGDLKVFLIFFVVVFFTKILLTIFCNWHKIGFVYKVRKFLTNRIYNKLIRTGVRIKPLTLQNTYIVSVYKSPISFGTSTIPYQYHKFLIIHVFHLQLLNWNFQKQT